MNDETISTTGMPEAGDQSTTGEPEGSTDIAALQRRLEYLEADANKARAARDKAKAKARELEIAQQSALQSQAQRLAEAGEYREAHDQLAKQLADAQPRLQRLDELEAYVQTQVANARDALPEALRDSIPESMAPTEQLKLIEALKAHTQKITPKAPPVAPAGSGPAVDIMSISSPLERQKAINAMTKEQRSELAKTLSGKLW